MKRAPLTLAQIPVSPDSNKTIADCLPDYANPEQIVIDMDNLGRVAGWAGFYEDVQLRSFAGQTSRQTGGFVQKRNGGHRSVAITNVQPTVSYVYDGYDTNFRRRSPLSLMLNTNELTQRVQGMNGNSLRRPEAWATQINNGLAQGLRTAGRRHLISGDPLPRYEAVVGGWMALMGQAVGTFYSSQELWADQRGIPNLIFGTLPSVLVAAIKGLDVFDNKGLTRHDYSFSLFPVWQLDRMAAVAGLTRVLRFAEAM